MAGSLGTGEVWSDEEKTIIHFGLPIAESYYPLLDAKGKPIHR